MVASADPSDELNAAVCFEWLHGSKSWIFLFAGASGQNPRVYDRDLVWPHGEHDLRAVVGKDFSVANPSLDLNGMYFGSDLFGTFYGDGLSIREEAKELYRAI